MIEENTYDMDRVMEQLIRIHGMARASIHNPESVAEAASDMQCYDLMMWIEENYSNTHWVTRWSELMVNTFGIDEWQVLNSDFSDDEGDDGQ